MTVLEAEEETDEQPNPPRKKLCLSLSAERRNLNKTKSDNELVGRASTSQARPFQISKYRLITGIINTFSFCLVLMLIICYSAGQVKMLNDFQRLGSSHRDSGCDITSNVITGGLRIATLCNLGNTCFLNSVLYTLRCTPSFLHNLHHLVTDLSIINEKQLQTKVG